jgi:hypothetical protein
MMILNCVEFEEKFLQEYDFISDGILCKMSI